MADKDKREGRDLGQRQAEDLNEADWNQREGSQADPQAETEAERRENAETKNPA